MPLTRQRLQHSVPETWNLFDAFARTEIHREPLVPQVGLPPLPEAWAQKEASQATSQ